MALAFKLSVLNKTHIWTPFNVRIPLNDPFSETRKLKYFLDPPPPKKKRLRDMSGRDMAKRIRELDIYWSRLSDSVL